jgi:hypothetical protein
MGPYMMTLSLVSCLLWALHLVLVYQTTGLPPSLSSLTVALIAMPLILVGAALAFLEKPLTLRSLLWIPFIYTYWFLQTLISGWAFLQIVFRRPKRWQKTAKRGATDVAAGVIL